jgi:hypothetical protein
VLSTKEMTARVDAVDAVALRRFATKLCERGGPAMASIGPVGRLESLERFARRFGRAIELASA